MPDRQPLLGASAEGRTLEVSIASHRFLMSQRLASGGLCLPFDLHAAYTRSLRCCASPQLHRRCRHVVPGNAHSMSQEH